MLAVRLHAPGERPRIEEVAKPDPTGTEVLVRVAACGMCRTDVHIVDGIQPRVTTPVTLGHEVAGWIDAAGPEAAAPMRRGRLRRGDAVLVFGGWGCGDCDDCRAGEEQRCADGASPGFQRDGGYAEFMVVPHPRHLVSLGRLDPVEAAPLVDAGVTPYRAVRRAVPWLTAGGRVLLLGCGALGQYAIQHLRQSPAGDELLIGVRELDPARLERASELGADVALLDGDAAMAREALGGSADVVLDLVGADETLAHAAEIVRSGGLVMLVGEAGGRLSFGFEQPPVEAWLTTTAWGSVADLREVVGRARRGRLHGSVERVPLREAVDALERLRGNETAGRLVLVP